MSKHVFLLDCIRWMGLWHGIRLWRFARQLEYNPAIYVVMASNCITIAKRERNIEQAEAWLEAAKFTHKMYKEAIGERV